MGVEEYFRKAVVVGNTAHYLGPSKIGKTAPTENPPTHRWKVYLKGYKNSDISPWISRVEFKLHETFADPVRNIVAPPYEVEMSGWGEFVIVVTIYFTEGFSLEPVTLYHQLRLWSSDGSPASLKKPLVTESYDEIVFCSPPKEFAELLKIERLSEHDPNAEYPVTFSEAEDIHKIEMAMGTIRKEQEDLQARLAEILRENQKLQDALDKQ